MWLSLPFSPKAQDKIFYMFGLFLQRSRKFYVQQMRQ